MIWLGWVLWHINHGRLLSFYTYILNVYIKMVVVGPKKELGYILI